MYHLYEYRKTNQHHPITPSVLHTSQEKAEEIAKRLIRSGFYASVVVVCPATRETICTYVPVSCCKSNTPRRVAP